MKRSIVWFKTDLRLNDNEALFQAIAQSDEVIPVYCFDDAHFKTTNFGFKKTGNFRAQFLIESLIDCLMSDFIIVPLSGRVLARTQNPCLYALAIFLV